MDNIMLVTDAMQYLNRCKSKSKYWAALKVDFQTAYDIISWYLIQAVLLKMQFPPHWI